MPATVSYLYVTVAGVASTSGDVISVSGQALQITINTAQATAIQGSGGSFTVAVQPGAGIKNPVVAKTAAAYAYKLQAKSTVDTDNGTAYVGFIPTYSISPTAANRMTGITVTGQGWASNSSIAVQGALSGTGATDATGSFTVTAYYTDAGAAASGGYVVVRDGAGQDPTNAVVGTGTVSWVSGNAGGESVTMPKFTLLPNITVTPTSGDVNSSIVVQGNDFTSGANLDAITMGGVVVLSTPVTLTSVDALGSNDDFKVTVQVPVERSTYVPMTTGTQTVTAVDSGAKTGSGTFTINAPTVTVSPGSGGAGTVITLTGKHFKAGDTIPVTVVRNVNVNGIDFAGTSFNTSTITVNGSGEWTYTGKVSATAPAGYNIITVYTSSGTITGTYFAVGTRSLTITPSTGPLGTTVVMTGSNMTKDSEITAANLDINGNNWPTNLPNSPWTGADITIDSNGNIQATTLQIPGTNSLSLPTSGALTATAMDNGNATATGTFTVVRPTITISPATGVVGTTITVVGSGFVPGDEVGIYFAEISSTLTRMARPDVDASGAFTATFAVPYNIGLALGDTCDVTAQDSYGNNPDAKTFTVSTGAVSISPTSGTAGTAVVTVTGTGLLPGTKITSVSIDGWDVTPDKLPQVGTDGNVTTNFTVPSFIQAGVKVVNVEVTNYQPDPDVVTTYTSFITVAAGTAVNTVTARLAVIDGQYDQVWTLDAGTWKLYDPSDVTSAEFTTLSPGMAIYIHTTQAVSGVSLGGVVRNLVSGWNMIGWVS